MKLESLALHHGYQSEPTTKAAAVPIYQTTSYTFDNTQHGADLFDLKVDPGEKDDRRRVEAARFERLKRQYLDWNARMLPRPASSSLQ